MKNKAKCKLCKDILESFAIGDVVTCSCGEITIWGGDYELNSNAKDYKNFLRIGELGEEIEVQYKEKVNESKDSQEHKEPISLEELLYSLESSISAIEKLPDHAKYSYVTHADLLNLMIVIKELFKIGNQCG